MRETFTGLRAIRENIQPEPSTGERMDAILEEEVNDIEQCLAGNPASKRWQKISVELANKKQELLFSRRRHAGRQPSMDSWNDPL